jgi:spore coat protein H
MRKRGVTLAHARGCRILPAGSMRRLLLPLVAVSLTFSGDPLSGAPQERPSTAAITAAEFFSPTKVWDATLTLTADAHQAIQPKSGWTGGGGGFGFGRMLGPEGGRNGVAARQGVVFDYVHANLDIGPWHFDDVAARHKGNGSYLNARGTEKISVKVDLNKYVKGQKLAGVSTLNFQNNITDIGWMNESLAYRLYRDAGAYAPRTTYARLYLTIGDQPKRYLGLYSISENVDENFIDDRFGTRQGAIFKPSTQQPFTWLGADWRSYNQTYDPKTDLTDDERQRIIDLGALVSQATDAEFAARIADFVDLDAFARYFAVLVWIANSDSLLQVGQNYYTFLHPETNKLYFIAWDQDFSFGNRRFANTSWTIHYPWSGTNPFLGRIHAVEAFRSAYLAALRDLSTSHFVPERFAAQLREIAPVIRPSVELEGSQWLPGFDQIASGQSGILPYVTARAAFVQSELARAR